MDATQPAPRAIRPFPWASLESTTRTQVAAERSARRWASQFVAWSRVEAVFRSLLGTDLRISVRSARSQFRPGDLGEGVGILLSSGEGPEGAGLLVVENALAAAIVACVVKREAPVVVDAGASHSAALAGTLAAVFVAVARRSHASCLVHILDAGPATSLESQFVNREPEPVALVLTVLVGDEAYAARVILSRAIALATPPLPWNRAELTRLGAVPLSMPIVACAVRMDAAEAGALRRDDVFLPGTFPLARSESEEWIGPLLLAPSTFALGVGAKLIPGGRVILGGDVVPVDPAEATMDEADESHAIVEAVGEIPVVVRVEIGQARMLAREWAALDRGDIVALGEPVGARVILRVGGIAIARGVLVDIEGEVGVRVVERLASEHHGA